MIDDDGVLDPDYEALTEAMSEGEGETVLLDVESEDNRTVQNHTEQDNRYVSLSLTTVCVNTIQTTTDKNNSKQQTTRRKNDRILWEKINNSQSPYEVHSFENILDVTR